MKIYDEPGKLEVVSFKVRELTIISEEVFCKILYRHTEQEVRMLTIIQKTIIRMVL